MVMLWHRVLLVAAAWWHVHKRSVARSTVYLVEGLALMLAGSVSTLLVLRAWA
jgi:hypothetical protein